jgi:hypothetical protein
MRRFARQVRKSSQSEVLKIACSPVRRTSAYGNGQWTVDNGQLGRVGRDDLGAPPGSRFVFKPERIFNMPKTSVLLRVKRVVRNQNNFPRRSPKNVTGYTNR